MSEYIRNSNAHFKQLTKEKTAFDDPHSVRIIQYIEIGGKGLNPPDHRGNSWSAALHLVMVKWVRNLLGQVRGALKTLIWFKKL
jgi:hypothetical protein